MANGENFLSKNKHYNYRKLKQTKFYQLLYLKCVFQTSLIKRESYWYNQFQTYIIFPLKIISCEVHTINDYIHIIIQMSLVI